MKTIQLLLLVALVAKFSEARLGLFEVVLQNEKQLLDFVDLTAKLNVDSWNSPTIKSPVRFSAPGDPEHIKYLQSHLNELKLDLKIVNANLDDTINKEMKENEVKRAMSKFKSSGSSGIHTYFAPFNEYNRWLQTLKDANPSFISLIDIGKSHEGREMKVLKISTGNRKEAIFIDGGIHAREWLAISSVVWILNKMMSDFKANNTDIRNIFNRFEVYILPVTNPDGYELSRKGGKLRLWRKNTMDVENGCKGIDLNRNFDSDFGRVGVSSNPCDIVYPGSKPFIAPETRNFRDFVLSIKNKLKLFISFHAYSQLLLTPWAYTKQPPPDNEELMRVAHLMTNEIYKTSGKVYQAGSPANILYPASGGCYDWVKQVGVKYSYTFEVQPNGEHNSGFIAPLEMINPTGQELYNAVVIAAKSVA